MRGKLLGTGLMIWLASALVSAAVLFVRSVDLSPDVFGLMWKSLWIGLIAALPIAIGLTYFRTRGMVDSLKTLLEIAEDMLSGKFRERFFPDTHTELDQLSVDLNSLAMNLRRGTQVLAESNAKIQAILDASGTGIMIFDPDGAVSAVNKAAQDILGRSDDELRGLSFAVALTNSNLASLISGALYRKVPGRQELQIGRRELRVVDATAVPLASGGDSIHPSSSGGVVLTMHDLTEIRRLERMRTDFVQNISHELRTPVTVVKGFAETLRDTPPEDMATVKEMAGLIEEEASRLTALVGSLLDLAKIESGSIVPSKVAMHPSHALRDSVRKLESLAAKKSQTIEVECDVPPDSELMADPFLTGMIFGNLLENAIKYTGEGGKIRLRVEPQGSGWLYSVSDNGPGIAEDDLPRVFERFYRASKDRSRGTGGSGLGLAIVKHAVTLHSGKVWAESKEGEGATFYVWLP